MGKVTLTPKNTITNVTPKCARHWAQQGSRVLFISKTPVRYLPLAIGNTHPSLDPDAFKLIQFMYLSNWQELLQQLYSIHLRHNPVSVIIIKNLGCYFESEDHASLVCASLLHAASVCAKLTSRPAVLINEYVSQELMIDKNIVKNFMHNIWRIKIDEDDSTLIKLFKLSTAEHNDIVFYTFKQNLDELTFTEVKKIMNL